MKKYLAFNDLHGNTQLKSSPSDVLEMARLGEIQMYIALHLGAVAKVFDIRGLNNSNCDEFFDNPEKFEVMRNVLPTESREGFIRLSWDLIEDLIFRGSVAVPGGLAGEATANMFRVDFHHELTINISDVYFSKEDLLRAEKLQYPELFENKKKGPQRINAKDRVTDQFIGEHYAEFGCEPSFNDYLSYLNAVSSFCGGDSEYIYKVNADSLEWYTDNGKPKKTARNSLESRFSQRKKRYRTEFLAA